MAIEVKENSRLAFKPSGQKSTLIKNLISDGEEKVEGGKARNAIVAVPLDLIDPLESFEHPFEKSIKKGIEELAESIKINDVLEPILLRPKGGGRYETLAGHRRTLASKLAEKECIDAIIKTCDNNVAKLIVTETNINQREEILPSERAKAYKLQMEALKSQGKRNDLLKAVQDEVSNLCSIRTQVKSRDIVAELNNTSPLQVTRYLRLNELVLELLDMVDEKIIPINAAVELSYLREKEQNSLAALLINNADFKVSINIAKELRAASKEMELSAAIIEATINPPKEVKSNLRIPKPAYKNVFRSVEKSIKRLEPEMVERLALADEKEMEKRIWEVIEEYLESL